MGNSNSDNYFTEQPTFAATAFKRSYVFYWVDSNINKTQENRAYLQILRQFVQITPFDRWDALASTIDAININQAKVCVISSSSLAPQAYGWLQYQKKVSKLLIFCGSQERASMLKSNYSKITNSFTDFADVINEVRELEFQDRESVYFYCEEDMERLNRWMLNWFTLQEVVRERGKEDFKQLMNIISPGSNDVKKFQKLYDISKNQSERQNMVEEWLKANNFYFRIPAEFLSKLRDTFSLALIRHPIFDIYNSVKTCYASKIYPDLQVYTRVSFNAHELDKIKNGGFRFLYFSTFLLCELDPGRKSLYNNQFRITLKLTEKFQNNEYIDRSGFLFDEAFNRVFLNIDNPFEVVEIDYQKRQMILQLVQIPKIDVQTFNELYRVQLHRRFIRYLAKIIPGQILPSYFNDQLPLYQDFVRKQLAILHQATNVDISYRKLIRKLQLAKIKLYFHLQVEQNIEKLTLQAKQLSKRITVHNNPLKCKVKIYFILVQINFRTSDFIKFSKCVNRLKQLFEQSAQSFNDEQVFKLKLYSIYCYVSTNKTQIQENLQQVRQIEASSNIKLREDSKVSELYFILMLTKIKCEQLRGNFNKTFALFDQIISNIKICQGQNSVYLYFEHLKLELQLRKRKSINQKEKEGKKNRITSEISLQDLSSDPYAINLNIDSELFKSKYDFQYFN